MVCTLVTPYRLECCKAVRIIPDIGGTIQNTDIEDNKQPNEEGKFEVSRENTEVQS